MDKDIKLENVDQLFKYKSGYSKGYADREAEGEDERHV